MSETTGLDERLVEPPAGEFDPAELDTEPEPVRRHLQHAIAAGTPIARSVRLTMRGHIKLGRWLPFRAEEVLSPHRGFVWRARVAGLITGSDCYIDGEGAMAWKIAGLVPFLRVQGADVSRSAAGRVGGEAIWAPTALLPRLGVKWSAESGDRISCRYELYDTPIEVHHELDSTGAIRSSVFDRWGDPDRTGTWAWHSFGGDVSAYRTFHGLTIPSEGRIGWHFGTERWPAGEFFRYRITSLEPIDRARSLS